MARRLDDSEPLTESELAELRRNLSMLSGPCVEDFYRQAHKVAALSGSPVYSARHTFLTRLGENGCDTWTLARIAGHSSIAIPARYVHPSEDAVLTAMAG